MLDQNARLFVSDDEVPIPVVKEFMIKCVLLVHNFLYPRGRPAGARCGAAQSYFTKALDASLVGRLDQLPLTRLVAFR